MNDDKSNPAKQHDQREKPSVAHEPSEAPKQRKDEKLDKALEDSFPASDPVSP
jgi:hypothetical protein